MDNKEIECQITKNSQHNKIFVNYLSSLKQKLSIGAELNAVFKSMKLIVVVVRILFCYSI